MTLERFAVLAGAYGGDLRRWPAVEREAARTVLRTLPTAQTVLAEAARLDRALSGWRVPEPPAALSACIAAAVTSRAARVQRMRLWFSSLCAAATLACGVAAGAGLAMTQAPAPDGTAGWWSGPSVLGAPLDLPEQPPSDGSL